MKNTGLVSRAPITTAGLIMTLGVVFSALGTSPLYVMKAVVAGSGGIIDQDFILGIVSCLIWTLTLQTTLKYVLITIRADNQGEGGLMALYALVRNKRKKLVFVAILGGSALLADGVITPSITIVSAVEGLQIKFPHLSVIPVTLGILSALFLIQKSGTERIGRSFGPIMLIWFIMLGALGLPYLIDMPVILKAFDPLYAVRLLIGHPGGLVLLGAIFLVTTGAEALYSHLGRCGYRNIRVSWVFVKTALLINYMGQAAWILMQNKPGETLANPFFAMMPAWFLPFGALLSTLAAIIAGQALISNSYTIISEAISLNFWPRLRVKYPTTTKGQIYISSVNWLLFIACAVVILVFRNSSNMEAAYGLAISIAMLMTTILMTAYLKLHQVNKTWLNLFTGTFLLTEGVFLAANMVKFIHGAWFTILLTGIIAYVMFIWFSARRIKNRFTRFVGIEEYFEQFRDISKDKSIPKFATNLVYLTRADRVTDVESKVIYSIFQKSPKRADTYWLLHVNTCDDPHTLEYSVDHLIPGVLIRVEIRLGFKVQPRINLLFNEIVAELVSSKEIDPLSSYPALKKHEVAADFRFIIIHRLQNFDYNFPGNEQLIMDQYAVLAKMALPDIKNYGLDPGNVMIEEVPLLIPMFDDLLFKRVYHNQKTAVRD